MIPVGLVPWMFSISRRRKAADIGRQWQREWVASGSRRPHGHNHNGKDKTKGQRKDDGFQRCVPVWNKSRNCVKVPMEMVRKVLSVSIKSSTYAKAILFPDHHLVMPPNPAIDWSRTERSERTRDRLSLPGEKRLYAFQYVSQ